MLLVLVLFPLCVAALSLATPWYQARSWLLPISGAAHLALTWLCLMEPQATSAWDRHRRPVAVGAAGHEPALPELRGLCRGLSARAARPGQQGHGSLPAHLPVGHDHGHRGAPPGPALDRSGNHDHRQRTAHLPPPHPPSPSRPPGNICSSAPWASPWPCSASSSWPTPPWRPAGRSACTWTPCCATPPSLSLHWLRTGFVFLLVGFWHQDGPCPPAHLEAGHLRRSAWHGRRAAGGAG